MNVIQRSSREFDNPELDVLLRNYFRSEMPDPWPAFQAPAIARFSPPARRWAPVRSKLALAASIGLLMIGSWCLSGGRPVDYSQPASVSPLGDPGAASGSSLKDLLRGKQPSVTPKKFSESKGCSDCDCCQ